MGAEAHLVAVEPEDLEVLQVHVVDRPELLGELLGRAVQVGVVHVHAAHAHEPEQFTRLLVAVAGAVLGQAQGEVTVAARFRRKDAVVMRAVHRLQVVPATQEGDLGLQFLDVAAHLLLGVAAGVRCDRLAHAFGELDEVGATLHQIVALLAFLLLEHFHRGEHRLGVIRQVAGGLVHLLLGQVRGLHAHIAGLELGLLGQTLQLLDQHRALGQPQRQAGPDVLGVHGEEPHLGADLPVVALAGLLLHLEPGVQLLLVLEGRSVQALELGVLLVAAEIRAGDLEQLDAAGLHVPRAHHMGAGAEVHELAVLEEADGLALGDVAQALDLEGLALALEVGQRLLAGLDRLLEDLVLLGDLAHLLLDLREIVWGEAVLQFEVVVEALFGGRPDVQQRIGPEPQDRCRQDVRAGVTQTHQFIHLLALVQRLALNLGLRGFKLGLLFVVHSEIGIGCRWTQMKAESGRLWQLPGSGREKPRSIRGGRAAHPGRRGDLGTKRPSEAV